LLTGSNNQFRNYEFEFSRTFDRLEHLLQVLLCIGFFRQKHLNGEKNSESSGFVVSELDVGFGEQDKSF